MSSERILRRSQLRPLANLMPVPEAFGLMLGLMLLMPVPEA